MSNVVGTPRSVSIEGVTYRCAADANISVTLNEYEKESIPSSGKPTHKFIRRITVAENIPLLVSWSENKTLINLADSLETIKFSIQFRGGDVIKGEGLLNLEPYESEEGRLPVSFLPDSGWTIFEA